MKQINFDFTNISYCSPTWLGLCRLCIYFLVNKQTKIEQIRDSVDLGLVWILIVDDGGHLHQYFCGVDAIFYLKISSISSHTFTFPIVYYSSFRQVYCSHLMVYSDFCWSTGSWFDFNICKLLLILTCLTVMKIILK